jgi:hypothetical protein
LQGRQSYSKQHASQQLPTAILKKTAATSYFQPENGPAMADSNNIVGKFASCQTATSLSNKGHQLREPSNASCPKRLFVDRPFRWCQGVTLATHPATTSSAAVLGPFSSLAAGGQRNSGSIAPFEYGPNTRRDPNQLASIYKYSQTITYFLLAEHRFQTTQSSSDVGFVIRGASQISRNMAFTNGF